MKIVSRLARGLEWWLAGICLAAALALTVSGTVAQAEAPAFAAMRNPYFTGSVFVLLVIWMEMVLRLLEPREQCLPRAGGLAVMAASGGWFFAMLAGGIAPQWISGMYLSGAVGAVFAAGALCVFLLLSGLVAPARIGRATWEWARWFGPVLILILTSGVGHQLLSLHRPIVMDPALLRMDEAFGFHAAVFFGSFNYAGSPLWDAQYVIYAGIGAYVLAIAGVQLFHGSHFTLRRYLLAAIFAALLGWLCYWVAPVVGPLHAWPELFSGTPDDRRAALQAALEYTQPMRQPPSLSRDCMPSLHTTWALLALVAAWKHGRRLFWTTLPVGALSIATTLTLCQHYTVDVLAALPFAALCWLLGNTVARSS